MRLSLKSRLTIYFSVLTGLLILVYSLFFYFFVSQRLEKIFQRDLVSESNFAAETYLSGDPEKIRGLNDITEELGIRFRIQVNSELCMTAAEAPDVSPGLPYRGTFPGIQAPEKWQPGGLPLTSVHEKAADPELDRLWTNATTIGSWGGIHLENQPHTVFSKLYVGPHTPIVVQVIAPRRDLEELKGSLNFWIWILIPLATCLAVVGGFLFSQKSVAPLEESYQRMKQFTADASHELRIPVAAIKGAMEVALRNERSVADYKECLTDSLEEIDRLNRLVDDLLTLSRACPVQLNLQHFKAEMC